MNAKTHYREDALILFIFASIVAAVFFGAYFTLRLVVLPPVCEDHEMKICRMLNVEKRGR